MQVPLNSIRCSSSPLHCHWEPGCFCWAFGMCSVLCLGLGVFTAGVRGSGRNHTVPMNSIQTLKCFCLGRKLKYWAVCRPVTIYHGMLAQGEQLHRSEIGCWVYRLRGKKTRRECLARSSFKLLESFHLKERKKETLGPSFTHPAVEGALVRDRKSLVFLFLTQKRCCIGKTTISQLQQARPM